MALQTIQLQATESNWRLFMVRKADPAFLAFEKKIFARDQYTCQFCGFQANQYQEVINLDGNYRNHRLSNLATACSFCAQCFFLETIGRSEFGGGSLIYLPEMTQGELCALSHVLFATIAYGMVNATEAKNIYRSLRLRSQVVEQQLGEGLSNPALYGQLLIDAPVEKKQEFNRELSTKLRVLPNMARFADQIAAWAEQGLQDLTYEN